MEFFFFFAFCCSSSGQTKLSYISVTTVLLLVSVLQESPGRTTSGSPRPAGRAGQPTVSSGSPMAAVKKPDPNMKGKSSQRPFAFIPAQFVPVACTAWFHSGFCSRSLCWLLNLWLYDAHFCSEVVQHRPQEVRVKITHKIRDSSQGWWVEALCYVFHRHLSTLSWSDV